MSEEQLNAFIVKIQADVSLQEKLNDKHADPVAIAKDSGFVITEDEVKDYQTKHTLTDNELEDFAGGGRDLNILGSTCVRGTGCANCCYPKTSL